jgi:hypothetical protein
MPLPKDIVVATPEELHAEREFIGSLLEVAVREGKVLYPRRKSAPHGCLPVGEYGRSTHCGTVSGRHSCRTGRRFAA